jgi:hypothetical protein
MEWMMKLKEAIGPETLDCISLVIVLLNAVIWPGIIGKILFNWATKAKPKVEIVLSQECKNLIAMLNHAVLKEDDRILDMAAYGWKILFGFPLEGSIRIRKDMTTAGVDIFPDFCEEEQKVITEEVRKAIARLTEKNRRDRLATLPKLQPKTGICSDGSLLVRTDEGITLRQYYLNTSPPKAIQCPNEESKNPADSRPVMLTLGDQIVQITVDDLPEDLKKKLKG